MGDIELVIKIPKKTYKLICDKNALGCDIGDIKNIIRNGTLLPKGHGKLVDADKFLKDNETYTGFILESRFFGGRNIHNDALEDLVDKAPTIIEKDR